MRFWDTSAIVPLVLREQATATVSAILFEDPEIVAWWGTYPEAISAFARLQREAHLDPNQLDLVVKSLDGLLEGATLVTPTDEVRATAVRLLLAYPLRAADALQLAAALIAFGPLPEGGGFVTLDLRLRSVAATEGFTVYPV